MAEEKAFEATHARMERAKREGDVARSQELSGVAAFAAGLSATCAVVAPLAESARAALVAAAGNVNAVPALAHAAMLMLVPAAAAGAAAAACTALQSGGVRFVALSVKANRLSPPENLKRMFSKDSAVTAARAVIAFVCAAAAIVPLFAALLAQALHASGTVALALTAWSGTLHAAAAACVAGGVFAGADFGLQFARWRKRLRMSFDELKREQKEQDGDPLARSRRRTLHRQLSRGSLKRIKDAAFVVTNPTHLAIALEYRPPSVPVPKILLRAADHTAARVREAAAALGIPLIENVALARFLYANADAGDFIPQESYIAVAEIVAALSKVRA
jgi:flagellar biosynthetic protein FlhB